MRRIRAGRSGGLSFSNRLATRPLGKPGTLSGRSPKGFMRTGDWIQTRYGVAFYPLDPRPEEIKIEDIAHALSNQCRFSGHVKEFYSVAEHSVHVSRICDPKDALWGLLHDAAEAYLQDMARPIKNLPGMELYRQAEHVTMHAVCTKFGMDYSEPDSVKDADKRMLAVEARDLMAPLLPGWDKWLDMLRGDEPRVNCPMFPGQARMTFLDRFKQLAR